MTYTHTGFRYVAVAFLSLSFLMVPSSFVRAIEIEVISGGEGDYINVEEVSSSTPPLFGGGGIQTGTTSSVIITIPGDGTETSEGSFSTTTEVTVIFNDPQNSKPLAKNRVNPVDISDSTPEFSVLYTNTHKSFVGTDYDIQVSSSPTFQSVWWAQSGIFSVPVKVGKRTPLIAYEGIPLASSTPYYWRMKIRDDQTRLTGNDAPWGTTTASFSLRRANSRPTVPTGLLVEGATNPASITDTTPEFSAVFNDPDSADWVRRYRIEVSTSTNFKKLWWDSGTITFASSTPAGSRIQDVSYSGTPLVPGTLYYWRIRLWDSRDLSSQLSARASFRLK